ncbi:glyoxalase superfamily protein [Chitinophaga sp.]|uniref:glyoxalase superfamily protein n=1 Tax=Chitinophaga sp. TaxID=1869181 RepID=UPI002636E120|nr:glyoxalase superfamily protein [uncultured Chitinophaga sp.]
MTPDCIIPIFQVSDLNAAVAFYTNVLGFSVDFEFGSVVGIRHGAIQIHLSGPASAGNKKAVGEGHVYIFCNEVDDYYDEIRAKGANAFIPPGDRPYNVRDFAVKDADGNILAFGKSTYAGPNTSRQTL